MTVNELRNKRVETARKYLGVKELSAQHKAIVDLCNTRKSHHRNYKLRYTDPWCAGFDAAITIECGMTDIIPTEVSCSMLIIKAKEMGIWVEADDYVPQPGDSILYDWDDNGKGDNTGDPEHIGIVEEVKDGVIMAIEGNYSNSVKRRTLEVNGKYIRGYICPDFASIATDDIEALAKEVICGKWGNNPRRKQKLLAAGHDYEKVQACVNEIIDRVAKEVIKGSWGNGDERKKRLTAAGYDYEVIQAYVNKLLK